MGTKKKATLAASKRKKKARNPPRQLPPKHKRERLKPVSLHPLTFDQALDALLKVKPRSTSSR